MKQSKALIQTLREVPRDADVISQQLMIRAGMIQKLAAGIYDYLPLAYRSIKKFEAIVREELERDGCQELLMPAVQPAELWQESTRWSFYGKELLRFQDPFRQASSRQGLRSSVWYSLSVSRIWWRSQSLKK